MAMENAAELFGEYFYGMDRAKVIDKSGASPCADDAGNSLVLCAAKPVDYLHLTWRERFYFNNLGELQQVLLEREAGKWLDVKEAMPGAGWRPVFLEAQDSAFDLIAQAHKLGKAEAEKLADEFAAAALSKGLVIYFFPQGFAAKSRAQSYGKALDKSPEDLVMVMLMIDENGMKLAFYAPNLARKNALRYGEMIKR